MSRTNVHATPIVAHQHHHGISVILPDSRKASRATLNCQTLGNVRLCLKAKLAVGSLILRESARVHIPACGVVEVAGLAGLFRYLTGICSDARRILYSGAIDIEDAVPATTPHGTDSILLLCLSLSC